MICAVLDILAIYESRHLIDGRVTETYICSVLFQESNVDHGHLNSDADCRSNAH